MNAVRDVTPLPARGGRVTVTQGAALYVGAVLGTGVIALPGLAARTAGPASLVAWVGMVVLSVPLAGTFAALAARHPDAGGVATYVGRAFGPDAYAMTGWLFYLALPLGVPGAALFAGAYVEEVIGGGRTTVLLAAAALFVLVAGTNAFGLRVSGRAQLWLMGVLAVALVAVLVLAAPHASTARLAPFAPHGWWAVLVAGSLLLWAFAGWEAVTHLAGEFRDPAVDIRRATVVALVVVGVLYLGVATTVVLVLGPGAGSSAAPLSRLLAVAVDGFAPPAAAAVAVVLTCGMMNAYLAGGAKLGAALARDGALPRALAVGSRAGEVPRRSLAVLTVGGLVCFGGLAVTGAGVEFIVRLGSACLAAIYTAGTLAAIRLLPRRSAGRRMAFLALGLVVVLLLATAWHLVFPAAVSAAALAYRRLRARSARR